ncbi:MAG TPA: DUF192 domain-containing protein [Opitutaceae bacterium]|jgi:uncharacterized membrane protein (UPF0127 family)|nr:DUF192 domain-containing protein [Opitutaceae bacterium]
MKTARFLLVCVALMLSAGCARSQQPDHPAVLKTVEDYFTFHLGGHAIRLQIAVTKPEMERGLMERRGLGRDDGMLFVFSEPQQMDFWMHDTPTALDIGFFDHDGRLEEIYQMQPFDETTTASRSKDLQFALEMNEGWFSDNGVKPDVQLDFAELDAALKARGFEPKDVGLAEAAGAR